MINRANTKLSNVAINAIEPFSDILKGRATRNAEVRG